MEDFTTIKKQTIRDFAGAVASDAPTPGGGAVGAVAIAFAASCALKTVVISLKHKKQESLDSVSTKLGEIIDQALAMADADASSFRALMDAFRLGRVSAEDVTRRRSAIATAAARCVTVGQGALALGNEVEALLSKAKPNISPNMMNDVHAAIALLKANAVIQQDNLRENSDLVKKFSS
jgi:formiminotetrahydrofolate cyclodeaminase